MPETGPPIRQIQARFVRGSGYGFDDHLTTRVRLGVSLGRPDRPLASFGPSA